MLIGYARVSTTDQTLETQADALTAAGCEKLFTDVASGARTQRPGIDQAIAFCRLGDTGGMKARSDGPLNVASYRNDPTARAARGEFSITD